MHESIAWRALTALEVIPGGEDRAFGGGRGVRVWLPTDEFGKGTGFCFVFPANSRTKKNGSSCEEHDVRWDGFLRDLRLSYELRRDQRSRLLTLHQPFRYFSP